jgi:hypothetical protein
MSLSQDDVEPKVIMTDGESYYAGNGTSGFKWIIRDFRVFLDAAKTFRSPSFKVGAADPSTKIRLFHLELEIPNKERNTKCPIYLVNETGGDVVPKIALEGFSPQHPGPFYETCKYVLVNAFVGPKFVKDRKQVMTLTLPRTGWNFPDGDVIIKVRVAL